MPHIDHGAHVGLVDLFDQEQGLAHRADEAVGAWLLGLVLDHQLDLGHVLGALDGALDDPVPGSQVVGLEGIIVAILAEPQVHHVAVHLAGPLHRLFHLMDRLTPDIGIVGREGPPAPFPGGPDIRRDASDFQTSIPDLAMDLRNVVVVDVPQAHHLDPCQSFDAGGGLNELLAREALAIARKDISVGTSVESVDVCREPQICTHAASSFGILLGFTPWI